MILSRFSILAAVLAAASCDIRIGASRCTACERRAFQHPAILRADHGPAGMAAAADLRIFDYRQCLQAAADMRGNCVINIDYPYEIRSAPRRKLVAAGAVS